MPEIHDLTAAQLCAAYSARTLSPVEVAAHAIARRDAAEPELNAFTHTDDAVALAAARRAEARYAAGAPLGPADGVTATIKGNVAVAGWPFTRGSLLVDETPLPYDGPATRRLREAGCVVLGQTAMPEFGWKGLGDSPRHGATRNPWDATRTTGGSSAGAGAAAARGVGVLHVGTDGLGSVRIPAAFCGVAGLKPTQFRVPAWPASPMGVLATLGPLARRVADVALLLELIAQPDPQDSLATREPAPAVRAALGRSLAALRIAWSPRLGYARGLEPDVERACALALERLAGDVRAVEAAEPGFDDPLDTCNAFWHAGSATVLETLPPDRHGELDPGFLRGAERGLALPAPRLARAMAERAELCERMRVFHERFDLLATPAMPTGALPLGADVPADGRFGDEWTGWSPYTYPFNLSGQPAATVPVGRTADGLPIGLQLVGRPGEDALVLAAAAAVEAQAGFWA